MRCDADDVARDQLGPLAGAVFRMLERALPFEHRPALKIVTSELGEDGWEVDLPITGGTEAGRPVYPALIARIDALLAGRIELGVLDMEHLDPLVVEIDVLQVVELLQHEVARVVE